MTSTDVRPNLPATFDPTQPPDASDFAHWTIDQVQLGLRIIGRDLYDLRRTFGEIILEEGEAGQALARARAEVRTKQRAADIEEGRKPRTIPEMDDLALLATKDEAIAHLAAETRLETAREARRLLISSQTALQTVHGYMADLERTR